MKKGKVTEITKRQLVENQIRFLYKKHHRITPELVLKDAADTSSPLHSAFQWNNDTAAHAHRLDQARKLIASVELTIRTTRQSYKTIAYVRDPRVPANRQGYVSVEDSRKDPKLARECVEHELNATLARMVRLRDLAVALKMEHIVEEAMQQFQTTVKGALSAA